MIYASTKSKAWRHGSGKLLLCSLHHSIGCHLPNYHLRARSLTGAKHALFGCSDVELEMVRLILCFAFQGCRAGLAQMATWQLQAFEEHWTCKDERESLNSKLYPNAIKPWTDELMTWWPHKPPHWCLRNRCPEHDRCVGTFLYFVLCEFIYEIWYLDIFWHYPPFHAAKAWLCR